MPPTKPLRPHWFSPWDLVPLVLGTFLLFALPTWMKGLPDPLPTHFNAAGHPNGWTPQRAYLWFALGLPAFIWALLLLVGRVSVGTDQDPEGRQSAAMAPLRGLTTTGLLLLMLAGVVIPRHGLRSLWWFLGLFLGCIVLGLVLMVRELNRKDVDLGNPDHYRWGLFYVNPQDPAVWVPKRIGLGWTLNFAHRASWWWLLLLLLPVFLVVMLSRFGAS